MNNGGLSRARLDRMHQVMAGYVERGDVPGIVTLISRRGEVHVDTIGTQALGTGEPMRQDTIFRISSMTKPITAVATMILIEECKLRLDEPVDQWLPELANRKVLKRLDGPLDDSVAAERAITVRDLLTFRMGFGLKMVEPDAYPILKRANEQGIGMGPPRPATMPDPDEWMRRLGLLPLMAQPGEQWIYNTAADVLGVLVARVVGQPFEVFLRERIFEPLGMHDTSFSVPAPKLDRLATSYQSNEETGLLMPYDAVAGSQWSRPPAFPSGAGGLVSTVDDYLAFGQMLLHKGKYGTERILSRPAIEVMTTDQLTPEQRTGAYPLLQTNSSWGFGMSMVTKRDEVAGVPGRFGWPGGLGTTWMTDPKEELVAILMTQVMAFPGGLYENFWTSVYQAIDD